MTLMTVILIILSYFY